MDTGRDIGWAISMMRKSGKVHRLATPLTILQLKGGNIYDVCTGVDQPSVLWEPLQADLLATDWELAGE
jgi:hypothetical protein